MKKFLLVLISISMLFCMSGCALVPSLDLTEDEQKVIAEYAAGLLLKYDKNYSGVLKRVEEEEDDGMQVVDEPVRPEVTSEEEEFIDPEFSEDLTASEQNTQTDEIQYTDMSISESIGLEGFDVIYKSYEAHNIYPEEQPDDMVFSLQAQNGMELLVLNFGITNDSDTRRACNVIDTESSFRILINGTERVNASTTMLLNDFSSYNDEIEGYGMSDAVLVFEVAEGTCDSIESIDLIIKRPDGYTTHRLR